MSYRDDFNSSMSSPGNYSPSSNYGSSGYSGGYGGTNNPGSAFTTPAQANFAAQGGSFGPGGGFGSLGGGLGGLISSLFGQQPPAVTSGPIPPALGPQGVPTPRRLPPVTQEDIPGAVAPYRNYPVPRPMSGFPANPGGQFGPRTYNDGYQTMRADKFQNNPAYGSPGGGLGQYGGGYSNGPTYSPNAGGFAGGTGGPAMGGGWNYNGGSFGGPR